MELGKFGTSIAQCHWNCPETASGTITLFSIVFSTFGVPVLHTGFWNTCIACTHLEGTILQMLEYTGFWHYFAKCSNVSCCFHVVLAVSVAQRSSRTSDARCLPITHWSGLWISLKRRSDFSLSWSWSFALRFAFGHQVNI